MGTIGFTGIRKLNGLFAVYLDSELLKTFGSIEDALSAIENETYDYEIDLS